MEYTPAHSRKSSYGPVTPQAISSPTYATTPASKGLGIGLVERNGQTVTPSPPNYNRMRSTSTYTTLESPSELDENAMRREKGLKRKPVPRIVDQSVEGRFAGLDLEEGVHAL